MAKRLHPAATQCSGAAPCTPDADDVLIRVAACGLNNTDVNTRSGWYSKGVSEATTGGSYYTVSDEDPTWGGRPITFPRIQGADICGQIVAVGANIDPARIGERVITDNWLRDPTDPLNMDKTYYFGSECDAPTDHHLLTRCG